MDTESFVKACHDEMLSLLADYFDKTGETKGGSLVEKLDLSDEKQLILQELLKTALTDTYYKLLLSLDGESSLGKSGQQHYKLYSEDGTELVRNGNMEELAYFYFHEKK